MRAAVVVLVVFACAPARAQAPAEGIEALCAHVARVAGPFAHEGALLDVRVSAEGAAVELADTIRARCRALVEAQLRASGPKRIVLVRVRLAQSSLLALVEVFPPANPVELLATATIDVPAGAALSRWVEASGAGLETWIAGEVNDEVLAICGVDANADHEAEVAVVGRRALHLFTWGGAALRPWKSLPLPETLRPRARVPGATASCRARSGVMEVTFGIHDRERGAVVRPGDDAITPRALIAGIPLGTAPDGSRILARGVAGTGLIEWRSRQLAAAAVVPGTDQVVGVTQDGAPFSAAGLGATGSTGSSLAVLDLDGDGRWERVGSRPILPSVELSDRLVVTGLDDVRSVRAESTPLPPIGAIGAVQFPRASRVLAAYATEGRTVLVGFGHRFPEEAP